MAMERRSAEEWRELVEEWLASGLSRAEFAARRRLNAVTLGWWKWKLGVRELPEVVPAFVEVVVDDAPSIDVPDFVVELEHVRVRVACGFDAGELRRLVGALC
jgi:hypothetical protein